MDKVARRIGDLGNADSLASAEENQDPVAAARDGTANDKDAEAAVLAPISASDPADGTTTNTENARSQTHPFDDAAADMERKFRVLSLMGDVEKQVDSYDRYRELVLDVEGDEQFLRLCDRQAAARERVAALREVYPALFGAVDVDHSRPVEAQFGNDQEFSADDDGALDGGREAGNAGGASGARAGGAAREGGGRHQPGGGERRGGGDEPETGGTRSKRLDEDAMNVRMLRSIGSGLTRLDRHVLHDFSVAKVYEQVLGTEHTREIYQRKAQLARICGALRRFLEEAGEAVIPAAEQVEAFLTLRKAMDAGFRFRVSAGVAATGVSSPREKNDLLSSYALVSVTMYLTNKRARPDLHSGQRFLRRNFSGRSCCSTCFCGGREQRTS